MSLLIINASPRTHSTSEMFCRRIEKKMGGKIVSLFESYGDVSCLLKEIDQVDTIVVAGPCYVNSYPAYLTFLLEELSNHPQVCHGQKLYGIINGGMPYVHTHDSGLLQLKMFCKECQMHYMGGFVMGLGPILNGEEIEQHLNAKKYVPAFNLFCEYMKKGEYSPESVYEKAAVKMPAIMARFMSYFMSRNVDKNLISHGLDPKKESPYLSE